MGSQGAKGSMREVRLELWGGTEHGQRTEEEWEEGCEGQGGGEGSVMCSDTEGPS